MEIKNNWQKKWILTIKSSFDVSLESAQQKWYLTTKSSFEKKKWILPTK